MTREEAIQRLKQIKTDTESFANTYKSEENHKDAAALDMAIEALQFVEHFDLLKEYQSLQEVVQCKDCRYCTEYYDRDGYPYWECTEWDGGTDADGFCHYGERREP